MAVSFCVTAPLAPGPLCGRARQYGGVAPPAAFTFFGVFSRGLALGSGRIANGDTKSKSVTRLSLTGPPTGHYRSER